MTTTADAAARPRRADAQRNHDRLVAAARAVFAERGSEASIEEIARRADVGVGTLYRHFPRRIDLVEAVYREDVDALVARGRALLDEDDTWQALSAWLSAFVAYAATKRTFLTELREAFEKLPDLAVTSREKIASTTAAVLERAQAAGTVRDDVDARALLHLVGGMCMAPQAEPGTNERLLPVILDGLRTGAPTA